MKFYACQECHQVSVKLIDEGKPLSCCEKEMMELQPSEDTETVKENKPTIRKIGNFVTITVENHPMIDVHHISLIFIETNQGFKYQDLQGKIVAKAEFILAKNEDIINVFVYCNIHQLTSLY